MIILIPWKAEISFLDDDRFLASEIENPLCRFEPEASLFTPFCTSRHGGDLGMAIYVYMSKISVLIGY